MNSTIKENVGSFPFSPDSASSSTETSTQLKPWTEVWSFLNEDQDEPSQDMLDQFELDEGKDTSQDLVLSVEDEPKEEIEVEIFEPVGLLDYQIEKRENSNNSRNRRRKSPK